MGIKYPLPTTPEALMDMQSRGGTSRTVEQVYSQEMQEFDIFGFAPEPLRATNTASPNFKAALAFDELGELIVEYRLPLHSIFQVKQLTGGETFTVGIRINEPPKDINDDDNSAAPNPMGGNAMGGGMAGGNPMMGGGNPMMNPNDPRNANRSITPRPQTSTAMPNVWIKVVVGSR